MTVIIIDQNEVAVTLAKLDEISLTKNICQ